jgi:hypothetical protein
VGQVRNTVQEACGLLFSVTDHTIARGAQQTSNLPSVVIVVNVRCGPFTQFMKFERTDGASTILLIKHFFESFWA